MINRISTILLTGTFVAATSVSAFAMGCNSGHVSAEAEPVQTQIPDMASSLDGSQVLSTGQMSVATADCADTPDAPECVAATTTN